MVFALSIVPLVLLLAGFPIFIVLLVAVSVALVGFSNMPIAALHQNMIAAIDNYSILAVPFFIFAGDLMGRGSVAPRIVDFVQSGLGRIRGSLGLTVVGTTTIFGAISGSSAASVATIGRVLLPAMRKERYPEHFSAGLITAIGAIDIIIPPSIPMIIYGAMAQESVPRLYAAGILPGILMAGIIALYVVWFAHRHAFSLGEPFSLLRFVRAFRRGLLSLGMAVIILGGIYGGVFSPTEAAAVASVYAILLTMVVYREVSWRDLIDNAATTAVVTGQIMIIVACATVFSFFLTVNQVPAYMVDLLKSLELAPWTILLMINVLLLLAGCVFDPMAAIIMLTPLMVPVVKAAGIDTVHFGIVVMINLAIGLFHPPFGINIFIAQTVLKIPLATLYRGIVPFLFLYLVALGLITYIPAISLTSMHLMTPGLR